MSINSRGNEYRADDYASNIGCGLGLISALYLLQNMNPSGRMSLTNRLKASHPYTADRIRRLEQKELDSNDME